jgi:hypothetical protein
MQNHQSILAALIIAAGLVVGAYLVRPAPITVVPLTNSRVLQIDRRTGEAIVCYAGLSGTQMDCISIR